MADHEYSAQVHEGTETTTHHVVLSPGFLEDLALPEFDETELVEQILRFLLDREPNTAVPHDFLFPTSIYGRAPNGCEALR